MQERYQYSPVHGHKSDKNTETGASFMCGGAERAETLHPVDKP